VVDVVVGVVGVVVVAAPPVLLFVEFAVFLVSVFGSVFVSGFGSAFGKSLALMLAADVAGSATGAADATSTGAGVGVGAGVGAAGGVVGAANVALVALVALGAASVRFVATGGVDALFNAKIVPPTARIPMAPNARNTPVRPRSRGIVNGSVGSIEPGMP